MDIYKKKDAEAEGRRATRVAQKPSSFTKQKESVFAVGWVGWHYSVPNGLVFVLEKCQFS